MATGRKHRRSAAYLNTKVVGRPCWRCGGYASTRDHRPPLNLHTHIEGSGCCVIRPACVPCNMGEGQRLKHLGAVERKARRVGALVPDVPKVW